MQVRHMIVVVLVLVVAVGATTGCSSKRKQSTPCAPTACAPNPCAPACPAPQPSCAPPCSPPVAGTWTTPPSPPLPPPPCAPNYGSPDGGAYSSPGAFPAPQSGMSADDQRIAEAIQSDRDARVQLHQEVVALRERLRDAELASTTPPAPCPTPDTGLASTSMGMGGGGQAETFANAMRSKTCGEVERQGSLVIIRLSDAFQPGSERLKANPSTATTLLAVADELTGIPGAVVEVVGHSDTSPIKKTRARWRDNVHLSRERAQTVASALSKKGVPASRMAVTGRGSAEPIVYPEKTSADRARNRRVEIRVRF